MQRWVPQLVIDKLFFFEIDVFEIYGMLHVKKMIYGTLETCESCCNI